jgi:hypothetical protein
LDGYARGDPTVRRLDLIKEYCKLLKPIVSILVPEVKISYDRRNSY